MNDKVREEFIEAFVKQFGFGRMAASSNPDAAGMLACAEWAWFASRESLVIEFRAKKLARAVSTKKLVGIASAHRRDAVVLRKDLDSHKRMLLAAACDIGAIGKALKADMNADGDELLGMVIDLKAQNTRMMEWLKDISRTSGDKGAVMGARQLLKEFAQ